MMRGWLAASLMTVALLAGTVAPAAAQHHDDFDHHDYHGRDFHHFSHEEYDHWRGGRWIHDWHDGRFGWWWSVDGGWYFYPQPIYPYPDYVPPAVVVQQQPPVPTGLPPAQYWYYCDNPQGYYPYVASCGTPWREVPAAPQPNAPPPGSAPPGPPGAPPPP